MDGANVADIAYAHELRGEQAEREAEDARERELLERYASSNVAHLFGGFQPINDTAELVERLKRADRYREALASIYRFVDELDLKLLEGELVEPEDKLRRSSELLFANEVIDGIKSRIQRMYIGKAGG